MNKRLVSFLRKFHTATLRRSAHAFNKGVLERKNASSWIQKKALRIFLSLAKKAILIEDDLDKVNFITDINSRTGSIAFVQLRQMQSRKHARYRHPSRQKRGPHGR